MPLLDHLFAWLYWNPNRTAFTIPVINHPVVWYGLAFVFGFITSYFLLIPMFQRQLNVTRSVAASLVDQLTWFTVAGTIIGARLGHVFFYDWPRYQAHPMEILKVWEGGLASHGGIIGVILAILLYHRLIIRRQFPNFSPLSLLDLVAIPTVFVGFCIRIGNFINQEVIGKETDVPWAVIFGHPADGALPLPRHPVQLYEALVYLASFVLFYTIWRKKGAFLGPGFFTGSLLIVVFVARFILDFWKMPQSIMIDESVLQTGQLLSVPFILLGVFLLMKSLKKHNQLIV